MRAFAAMVAAAAKVQEWPCWNWALCECARFHSGHPRALIELIFGYLQVSSRDPGERAHLASREG